ncbi:MAG: MetQ/NlpA family ABC transporter substrate-binding protein, partial [Mogibacterium sp.]|nr:MetQ/NlpA family ABC transporter substrate-binding protein [Mogibacterium sp.]
MKNIKRIAAVSLVLVLSLCLLSGCGKKESDEKTIKVAACPTPHALVLEQISAELEKEGYSLEIVEFEDYVKPNQALT